MNALGMHSKGGAAMSVADKENRDNSSKPAQASAEKKGEMNQARLLRILNEGSLAALLDLYGGSLISFLFASLFFCDATLAKWCQV